jgi:hypothetical protein
VIATRALDEHEPADWQWKLPAPPAYGVLAVHD